MDDGYRSLAKENFASTDLALQNAEEKTTDAECCATKRCTFTGNARREDLVLIDGRPSEEPRVRPTGNAMRDDLVLTNGRPGISANSEAGRFREYPQYAMIDDAGRLVPLPNRMTDEFGKLVQLMVAVSRKTRPNWPGLANLKPDQKITVLVTCVVTGSHSNSKGLLRVEVMETMAPYYVHRLALTEIQTVTQASTFVAAFAAFRKDPAKMSYQIGYKSGEAKALRLDLFKDELWLKLVLSQRGLVIDF